MRLVLKPGRFWFHQTWSLHGNRKARHPKVFSLLARRGTNPHDLTGVIMPTQICAPASDRAANRRVWRAAHQTPDHRCT